MGDKFDEIVNKLKKNKGEVATPEAVALPPQPVTPEVATPEAIALPPQPVTPEVIPPQPAPPQTMETRDVDMKKEVENYNEQIKQLQDNGIFRLSLLREISEIRTSLKELSAAFKKLVE